MRVWDARTQSLTPEWLAHSKLAEDLTLQDTLVLGCGLARVTNLRRSAEGWIEITAEYLDLDPDDGGSGCWMSNPKGRWMIKP